MPKYDDEAFGSALIIFSVICAGANVALICSFIYHKKYKKNYHLAYLNLAVSDLVLALFGFSVRGPVIIGGSSKILCQISIPLSTMITIWNLLAVVPIAYDRLIATVKPTRYNERTHTTRLRVMIISFWVFGVVYTGIVKIYQHLKGRTLHQFDYEARECYFDCSYHKTLLYYTNLTLSRILPLLFNVIVYVLSPTPAQKNVATSKDDGCIVLGSPFCQDANRKHSLLNP
ncbi:uncharacterized protein LOC134814761 [Bolinopsis microptera]|uniref:uncharacterized protein LOC134814761 n=1 Tax=Bolinopsis microptera TaxID=2820187 RepID=UPI003079F62F